MRASRVLLLLAALLVAVLAFATAVEAVQSRSSLNPTAPILPGQKMIGPQFISSSIVWALLVALMLLFVLYIGVGCLMDIERPVRLSAVPLQLAKEY